MPIVGSGSSLLALATGSLPRGPALLDDGPGFFQTIGAAFRQDNLIGSTLQNIWTFGGEDTRMDLTYNPWDDIKGTPYESHWDSFVDSPNAGYTAATKSKVDQEVRDRQTLAGAGWGGTVAEFAASVLDPTIFIPVGGQIIKGAGVYRILDVGIRSALAGGLSTAVQEAGLHATQETRTVEESAYAIGGGFVLGGLLGAGVSAALSRADRAVALKGYDNLLPVEGAGGLSSAPAFRAFELGELSVAGGGGADVIAKATQAISPNMRLNFSPSKVARQVAQELSENTLYQAGHMEGVTTGAAVSRLAQMNYNARMAAGMGGLKKAHADMRKAGIAMSFDDFEQAVGRAMRLGDEGENEFISRAAKHLRQQVVEPFFGEGKAVGLYEEGDNVSFATSYFPRQYRKKVLIAREPEIKAEWKSFMEQRIGADYREAVARHLEDQQKFDIEAAGVEHTSKTPDANVEPVKPEPDPVEVAQIDPDVEALAKRISDLEANGEPRANKALAAELGVSPASVKSARAAYKRYQIAVERARTREVKAAAKAERAAARAAKRTARVSEEVAAKLARIAERKAAALRAFYDKWEIRNLGENIDPYDPAALPNFKEMSSEIIDDVYDRLTGRDYGASASVAPEYMTPIERGPVKERTLPIPDDILTRQGVLEDRASEVLSRYSRTLSADVELTRKFGDPRMDDALKRIAEDYAELRKGVADPRELAKLQKRQNADQRDLEAMRDLVRGTYKAAENGSNFGRVVKSFNNLNFVRSLGGVVVSSLSDLYRPAHVLGLRRFMGDGVAPLLRNAAAVKLSVKEAQLAGTVVDRVLSQRVAAIAGLADPLERGTPIERLLENMSHIGGKWSGINLWNDVMKSVTSIMSQNEILGGKLGTRKAAYLGIDTGAMRAISEQFDRFGETLDGVRIANTEQWTDPNAVRAFRAAVGKDVDRVIVTPGIGDAPLWAHSPWGKLLLQFKSYMFAAHQRVLIAGLQENKARFLTGMVAMTSLGMLSAYLKAWRAGRERFDRFKEDAQNPGYLIGEGLDNAGLFTLGFDFANTGEKLGRAYTGFSFNPIKTPLSLAGTLANPEAPVDGMSVRFSTQGPLSAVAGPTVGLIADDLPSAVKGGVQALQGKDVSMSHKRAAERLLPYNSFLGFKEMLQAAIGDSPYMEPSALGDEPQYARAP